ncbi:hypothetical protein B7L18_038315, partial [Burkholderia cenocepacia]|uniref:hypothetical protein n=1 Tax=Burkholderia cenocepacia TaxID=95486 RepID=UPI002237C7B7
GGTVHHKALKFKSVDPLCQHKKKNVKEKQKKMIARSLAVVARNVTFECLLDIQNMAKKTNQRQRRFNKHPLSGTKSTLSKQ